MTQTVQLDEKEVRRAIAQIRFSHPNPPGNGSMSDDYNLLANACEALLKDNRELMKLPPSEPCEACGAESGSWCNPGCGERPAPQKTALEEWGAVLQNMITMLACTIDDETTKAKNYVETTIDWSPGVLPKLPFRRVALTFFRPGGLSPHQRAEAANRELVEAKERITYLEGRVEELTVTTYKHQLEEAKRKAGGQ